MISALFFPGRPTDFASCDRPGRRKKTGDIQLACIFNLNQRYPF